MKVSLALTKDQRTVKEMFKRMVFNVVGQNCDDHSKNTSFLMNQRGEWKLSPAYDLLYSYGQATFGQHRMSISAKVDHIELNDLAQCGYRVGLEASFMKETIERVSGLFSNITEKLVACGVSEKTADEIGKNICQFSITDFPHQDKENRRRTAGDKVDPLTKEIMDNLK